MKQTYNKSIHGTVALIILVVGFLALRGNLGRSVAPGGSPQGPPPSGANMGMPPGGPGMSADFEKSHRYTLQLMRLTQNIGRLENVGKSKLTVAQAKAVLSILQPLRKRESLDQPSAKDAIKSLQCVLTGLQRSEIRAMPAEHQFRQNTPPSGPPPSGPRPNMNSKSMENFNPLNSAAGPPNQHGGGDLDKIFADLIKKSGGK